MWSPALASFLSVDEFAWHDPTTTLWGWPGQNPWAHRDPFGRGDDHPLAIGGILLTLLGFGAFAPSDTSQAPADVLGMASSVPGIGPAVGGALKAFLGAILEKAFPSLAKALAKAVASGEATGGVCKATDAMDAVRAACPGGQCDALSRALIDELGEGQLATLFPRGGGTLPTAPGVSSVPWAQHTAVQLPSGVILDPLANASYPSLSAWRSAVTGTADVGVMIDGAVQ
jgi:hypothetical protein